MSRKGWLLFVALCVIWGVPYMFTSIAVRELSAPTLVFFRTLPAVLLLVPLAWHRREFGPALQRWPWVLACAATELTVPWLLLSHAQKSISSSMTGLLIASVPLIGAVLYRVAGSHDPLDARRTIGLVVGFVGVAALLGIDVGGGSPLAAAEVLVAACCYATGPLIISRWLSDIPSLGVVASTLTVTAAVYAIPAMRRLPESVSGETVAAVAGLAFIATALGFLLFFWLIAEVGPSRATVVTYINPLVAVLLGVMLLSEPFTLGIAVGLPLILVGSALGTAPSQKAPSRRAPADDEREGEAPPAPRRA